jgi:guanylate kinase
MNKDVELACEKAKELKTKFKKENEIKDFIEKFIELAEFQETDATYKNLITDKQFDNVYMHIKKVNNNTELHMSIKCKHLIESLIMYYSSIINDYKK